MAWQTEAKEKLSAAQSPNLAQGLVSYYSVRNAGGLLIESEGRQLEAATLSALSQAVRGNGELCPQIGAHRRQKISRK